MNLSDLEENVRGWNWLFLLISAATSAVVALIALFARDEALRSFMMLVLIVTVGAFSTFLYKVMFAREIATARFMKKLPSVPMSAEVQEKLDCIISKELEDESINRMLDKWRYR